MSTYIRGPICGIFNCPSRLWRIIDGRRTCQYGHVMEGDVEFNNDDDDAANAGVITRRLNLTTNATGSFQSSFNLSQSQNLENSQRTKKVYGYEAHVLFLKAFQHILKKQSVVLIGEFGFPDEFESVVKIIWTLLLKSLNEEETNEEREMEASVRGHFKLNILSAIGILYMASIHIGLPVYTSDFLRWLSSAKLPFFKANDCLPKSWREKLPNYYLGLLEGVKVPRNGQLFVKVAQLCVRTQFTTNFNCQLRYEGLVFKLTTCFLFPPQFYIFTIKVIQSMDSEGNFKLIEDLARKFKKYYLWAEFRVVAYFILTVRWVLLIDQEAYSIKWIKTLTKTPDGLESSEETIDRQIAKLSAAADMNDVSGWDMTQNSNYLEWVQRRISTLPSSDYNAKIDHKIAMRKLHKIFPVEAEAYKLEPTTTKPHPSHIEELQERYNFFQASMQSQEIGQRSPTEWGVHERIRTISALEQRLVGELALMHGCSAEQLRSTMDNIELHCKMSEGA